MLTIIFGFNAAKGKMVDATQELLALGIGNMAGSFFHSMPITGSFTRTAVNNISGAKSQVSGQISIRVLFSYVKISRKLSYTFTKQHIVCGGI